MLNRSPRVIDQSYQEPVRRSFLRDDLDALDEPSELVCAAENGDISSHTSWEISHEYIYLMACLIISVACAIGIMRIINSVKKLNAFSLVNNSANKTTG